LEKLLEKIDNFFLQVLTLLEGGINGEMTHFDYNYIKRQNKKRGKEEEKKKKLPRKLQN